MKITGENGIGKLLEIFLQVCFYSGIILLIALPIVLNILGLGLPAAVMVIYPNGIVLLLITKQFIKLFKSLRVNNPFCDENTKILKSTSTISFVGSILWLIDFIYEVFLAKVDDLVSNITLLFLFVLFLGVSIALLILSELFDQATKYKEENELTI